MSERVQAIIENRLDSIDADLDKMEPTERVKAIIALMPFVMPKQQSINMANQIELEYKALGVLLEGASDEALTTIAAKMLEMRIGGES